MKLKFQKMLKLFNPNAVIVTLIIWAVILMLDLIRLNLHFLDPFNNGLKNYEITDIVSSRLRDNNQVVFEDQIVLVNTGKPDRLELAKMLERLNQFSPKAIGVDILLEGKKEAQVDSFLAEKIKSTPNLVLANKLEKFDDTIKSFATPVGCEPMFAQNAKTGFVNFVSKDNWTVRLFNPKVNTEDGEEFAFAVKITELAKPETLKKLWRRDNEAERIHYFGNINSFVQFDAAMLLDTALDLSYAFKDKIVLLGYLGNDEWNIPMKDRFFTPLNEQYAGRSLPDMYGLVIHANIIAMLIHGNYIYNLPGWLAGILELIFCYANVLLVFWLYKRFPEPFHGIARGVQIFEFVIVFLLIAVLFHYFKIRIDFDSGILALLLVYDFIMIYESFLKKKIPVLQRL